MARCSKTDAADAADAKFTTTARWRCVSTAAVQLEESKGSRFAGQLRLDPAVCSPSDVLTEVFFFFFFIQSGWSLLVKSLRAVNENRFREQRFTRQEKEKLKFFVAESSRSSS